MIYVDSSVLVAHLLAEDRRPPENLWSGSLVSSRLLEVEAWTCIHARGMARLGGVLRRLLVGLSMLDMEAPVLARALEPFPVGVRALDAIHLASADFLRGQGQRVSIATYDARMAEAARAMGFDIYSLD